MMTPESEAAGTTKGRNKRLLLGVLTWLLALSAAPSASAQICPNDLPNPSSCFRVYDDATGLPLDIPGQATTVLCAGARIRLRDCSGQGYLASNIRYVLGCFNPPNNTLDTVTTRTVPNAPGTLIIQQNTPRTGSGGGSGALFSRRFEVRARPQPDFTFNYCGANRTEVQITLVQPQSNVQYEVQIGSGPRQPMTQTTAVYAAAPGATSITVFGNYRDALICEGTITKPFPAQPTPQTPVLQRLEVQGTTLSFSFAPLQPEYRYELQQDGGSGNWQPVAAVPISATSFSLPNGALGSCYRLRLTDACGSSFSLPSAPLCPISLTVSSANRVNQLRWTQPAGSSVTAYDISRNSQLLRTVPAPASAFDDSEVTCGVTYRYRVTARSAGGVSVSEERSVQTVANQAPPAPQLTASFTLTNQVAIALLSTAPDPTSRLRVRRTLGGTSSQDLPESSVLPVLDQPGDVSPELVPCYSARLADPCGTISPESPAVCPPVLAAQAADADGNSVRLRWAEPQGQGAGWTYRIILLDAEGREIGSRSVSSGTTLLDAQPPADRQVLRYRLEATSAAGGRVLYSNVASVTRRVVIAIPTAFSPNGDGINDRLEIKGRYLSKLTFTLYDRNGLIVFRATDRTQTWDGTVRGVQAAPQVFSYQAEVIDETGKSLVQRGTVTLLR